MVDGAAILRRFERLKTSASTIRNVWRDCYRYSYPLRGVGLESDGEVKGEANADTAASLQADLYDSTATDSTRILASALVSGTVPANSRWFGLDVDGMSDAGRKWLDAAAESLWENIHQSNFDSSVFDCMLDMAIAGQFVMFCDEADGGGFRFEQWLLANTYFSASRPGQPVDTVFNEIELTAEQAVDEYGEDMVPEKVRKCLADNKLDEKFTFIRAIYPREKANGRFAKNLPIASCHIERESKKVVRESGYHEMPLGVPRWSPVPGTAYAFGPMFDALPDVKTLNTEVKFVLQNADLAIAGMWIAEDDGVLNARTIRIGPRKVVVANSVESMKALQPAGKFDVAALEIDRLQKSIRKVMMADQLTPQDGPAMTATEVHVRVEMIRQLLGPVYGRLQTEFLKWLVERTFAIAYRAGVFGQAPREIAEREISVQYISPISRAQKAVDVTAMDRYENSLALEAQATGRTDILDNYDWDKGARKRAELLGVPADLIPDADDVLATRQGRQQQQQQAMAGEMLATVVRDNAGELVGLRKG